jgi:urease accessory protein
VHVDWLTCGRRGRGERWAFRSYRSSLDVRLAGRLICHDALALDDGDGSISERLDRFNVLATIVLAGPRCVPHVQALVAGDAHPPERRADTLYAIAPFGQGIGMLLRLADVSLERTASTIRTWLSFLPATLGDDPWARKW